MVFNEETLTYFAPVNVSFRVVGKDKKGMIPLWKDYFLDLQLLSEAEYIKRRQVSMAQFNAVSLDEIVHITMYKNIFPELVIAEYYFSISEALGSKKCIGIALTKDKDCFNLCYNSVL